MTSAPSCWMMIETGSNQAYVFATTKQRLQLSASAVTRDIGLKWIPEALEETAQERRESNRLADYRQIVRASGLGLALVPDPEFGRAVIRRVTERALTEQIGVDVWGVVRPRPPGEEWAEGLSATWALHNQARYKRPSPFSRCPTTPFSALCALTGRPAAALAPDGADEEDDQTEGNRQPVSALVQALWQVGGRETLTERLTTALGQRLSEQGVSSDSAADAIGRAVMSRQRLMSGGDLRHNGWYGVLHADGNCVGRVFERLRQVFKGEDFLNWETRLSDDLTKVAWQAVAQAIVTVGQAHAQPQKGVPRDWILPIIVGGDDISVVVAGQFALEFAVVLARRFGHLINQTGFRDALRKMRENDSGSDLPPELSLSGGLAFTKPHHPFSHAITLAAELADSAKKATNRRHATLDVQVVREAALRKLAAMRSDTKVPLPPVFVARAGDDEASARTPENSDARSFSPWFGPFLVTPQPVPGLPHLSSLDAVCAALGAPPLSPPDPDPAPGSTFKPEADGAEPWTRLSRSPYQELRQALGQPAPATDYEAAVNRALHQLEQLGSAGPRALPTLSEVTQTIGLTDGKTTLQLDDFFVISDPDGPDTGLEQTKKQSQKQTKWMTFLTAWDLIDVRNGTAATRKVRS